jgi:YidC/Oxa1 family membrane protein insertase
MCVGPYHIDEIRRTEEYYGLKPKELVEAGSVKLDTVLQDFRNVAARPNSRSRPAVLVAPSWGTGSLIEMPIGTDVLKALLDADASVTLRLHPMTVRHHPRIAGHIRSAFGDFHLFQLEEDMNATESWLRADLMVSDWSGAATEFAFALEKPVIFVDTPQKIRNADWKAINMPAFEEYVRPRVGRVLALTMLEALAAASRELADHRIELARQIRQVREDSIFNLGRSAKRIADHVASQLPADGALAVSRVRN